MAIRVYRVAVLGCPRAIISPDGFYEGSGKSCLCNRFISPEAYIEDHQEDWSEVSEDEWRNNTVFNGDHFIYWGATNRHLPDKSKVRFQVVEQTEIYRLLQGTPTSDGERDLEGDRSNGPSEEMNKRDVPAECNEHRLSSHPSSEDYASRATAIKIKSKNQGKMAYRLKARDKAVRMASGPVRATTQLFSNEDFGGKKSIGIYGFICVFDPTLEGDQMQRQLNFLSELLPAVVKTKRRIAIACVKCDGVEDHRIRFGSKLSSYALKKTIPFFEVSARDSVNVDEIFYSLVSAPKKSKSSRKNVSGCLGYREVMDSRKGDLNRAKDTFRKFLQKNINDFSCTWTEVRVFLKSDYSYQCVEQLAGGDANEVLLKMFQLRLIEIKLTEASSKFGTSLAKKADKEQSKQYQVYLKDAFRGHPDLKTADSYKDYIPVLSESDELDDSFIFTEASTPTSSYCATPDLHFVLPGVGVGVGRAHSTRIRSATLSDLPDVDVGTSTLQSNLSFDGIDGSNGKISPRQMEVKMSRSPIPGVGRDLPPLPSRDNVLVDTVSRSSASPSKEKRRLSNSTDCLFSPSESNGESGSIKIGASYDRLDAEPYLRPMEVKMVMAQSTSTNQKEKSSPPKGNLRTNLAFLSMRAPKKQGKIRAFVSNGALLDDNPKKRRVSLELDKTHKRSNSNPFVLEAMFNPPELPPRKLDNLPQGSVVVPLSPHGGTTTAASATTTPSHTTPRRDSILSPMESSLEFHASPKMLTDIQPRANTKPLPPLPVEVESPEHARKVSTFSVLSRQHHLDEAVGEGDGDSRPFEEINDTRKKRKQSDTLSNVISSTGTLHTSESDGEDIEDDQYAEIGEFQQYMKMSSAPINKSTTMPAAFQRHHHQSEDSDGVSKTRGSKREIAAPLISTLKRKMKISRNESILEIDEHQSPPLTPATTTNTTNTISSSSIASSMSKLHRAATLPQKSPLHDIRPLPPSPTKPLTVSRKMSSGSNIYEVIDDEFVNRVRNCPSRQGSRRDALNWVPPVDQSLWTKYVEVVQTFFSLPQIQEQWTETVKSVMKGMEEVDPGDINPPYFKVSPEAVSNLLAEDIKEEGEEEEGEEEEEEEEDHDDKEGDSTSSLDENQPAKIQIHQASPSLKLDHALNINNSTMPLHVMHLHAIKPTQNNIPQNTEIHLMPPSFSPRPGSADLKQSAGSDELIYMMNQSQLYSDSESDSDIDSNSSDSDFSDFDYGLSVSSRELLSSDLLTSTAAVTLPPTSPSTTTSSPLPTSPLPSASLPTSPEPGKLPKAPPPTIKPKPKMKPKLKPKPAPLDVSFSPTDLDSAMELKASISNDSDLVSNDSALTKSPHSNNNSAGEFDMESEGVEVVHCVRPSQIIKKRGVFNGSGKPKSGVERAALVDSGTFENISNNNTTTRE